MVILYWEYSVEAINFTILTVLNIFFLKAVDLGQLIIRKSTF